MKLDILDGGPPSLCSVDRFLVIYLLACSRHVLRNSVGVFLQLMSLVGVPGPSPSHHYLMGEDNNDTYGSAHKQRLETQGHEIFSV